MSEEEGMPPVIKSSEVVKEEEGASVPPMPLGAFVKEEGAVPPMPLGAFVKEEGAVPPMPADAFVKPECKLRLA